MSTHLYLRCVNHDPHIESDELGHNLTYLDSIREDVANRDELVSVWRKQYEDYSFFPDFGQRNNIVRFMVAHPRCEYELWDEYDRQYPLEAEPSSDPDFKFRTQEDYEFATNLWCYDKATGTLERYSWTEEEAQFFADNVSHRRVLFLM